MLTIDAVKHYLSIDSDYKDDDRLLLGLINSTESAMKSYCNHEGDWTDNDMAEAPMQVQQAQLMLIAELYRNRELQTSSNLKQSPVWDILLGTSINHTSF